MHQPQINIHNTYPNIVQALEEVEDENIENDVFNKEDDEEGEAVKDNIHSNGRLAGKPTQNPAQNTKQNPRQNPTQNPTQDPRQNPTQHASPVQSSTQNLIHNPAQNPTHNPAQKAKPVMENGIKQNGSIKVNKASSKPRKDKETIAICENSLAIPEIGEYAVLMRFSVSRKGKIVYCCHKKVLIGGDSKFLYSATMIEDKWARTIIQEGTSSILSLTFLDCNGKEHLAFEKDGSVYLMDDSLEKIKCKLTKVRSAAIMCAFEENTVICMSTYPTKTGCYELLEARILSDNSRPRSKRWSLPIGLRSADIYKVQVKLPWEEIHDMCHMTTKSHMTPESDDITDDIIIVCSWKNNGVAAIRKQDGQIKWMVTSPEQGAPGKGLSDLSDAFSVCTDNHGNVFVACRQQHAIYKLSGNKPLVYLLNLDFIIF